MYLFYFLIFCDISLILAGNHNHNINRYILEYDDNISVYKRSPVDSNLNVRVAHTEDKSKLYSAVNRSDFSSDSIQKKDNINVNEKHRSSVVVDAVSSYANTDNQRNSSPFNESLIIAHDNYIPPEGYAPEITNDTLKKHNITSKNLDSHTYYNSSVWEDEAVGKHYWVEFDNRTDSTTHQMLSQSHRRAVTVPLPFKFQFYGHEIENVTIATGGFLYTGDYIHSWLAATQYIAPLMANFDTSLSNDSFIKYVSNSTTFTVLWENVSLQEQPKAGTFTFEATLCKNGDIIFVYKNIPNITNDISEDFHPVKIGLSDAYILDKSIFFVHRKTIFEYHRVHFEKSKLKNWTVIYLTPLPTCQTKTTCESCLSDESHFDCQWCDGRCSTGYDRRRQEWLKKDCDKRKVNETKYCNAAKIDGISMAEAHKSIDVNDKTSSNKSSSRSLTSIFVILVGCVSIVIVWAMYAYRNPHSTSGQILIRYRPSRWTGWRKGEARYTAATIHM